MSFAADSSPQAEGTRDVVVHVAGDVRRPGRLPAARRLEGDRRGQARRRLRRGREPRTRSTWRPGSATGSRWSSPAPARSAATSAAGGQSGPISLGSATVEQLDGIEGIGPVTAQKIIEFRDQHGGLSSINQLDEVDGIGPSTMQTLRAALQP